MVDDLIADIIEKEVYQPIVIAFSVASFFDGPDATLVMSLLYLPYPKVKSRINIPINMFRVPTSY